MPILPSSLLRDNNTVTSQAQNMTSQLEDVETANKTAMTSRRDDEMMTSTPESVDMPRLEQQTSVNSDTFFAPTISKVRFT